MNEPAAYKPVSASEQLTVAQQQWVSLLKQALEANERVQPNHRYRFQGKALGTFLVGVSAANKKGKKAFLFQQVEATGFSFFDRYRNPEDVASRFINQLFADKNPDKNSWRSRFYKLVKKREVLHPITIEKIEHVWQLRFNERPKWEKLRNRQVDYTQEWKAYRQRNGSWYPIKFGRSESRCLYHWVRNRLRHKALFEKIAHQFGPHELNELHVAGFTTLPVPVAESSSPTPPPQVADQSETNLIIKNE